MEPPRLADARGPAIGQDAGQLLTQYEKAWQNGLPHRLEDYAPPRSASEAAPDPARIDFLKELIKLDLEYGWRNARGTLLENYIQRYPELVRSEALVLQLIGEEYRARHLWGDRPRREEYADRFAQYWPQARQMLLEIDAELDAEFGPQRSVGAISSPAREAPGQGTTPCVSVPALVNALRDHALLNPTQIAELTSALQARFRDPRELARELMQRDWLTPYQVNQVLQGRGHDLVLGPYVILARLGEGGAGQVFKARHQKMNRVAALKLIRKELLADAEVVARFYREIRLVSQLDHPNIVHAYDAGPVGATHFLAMEYIEGSDLGKLVKQSGPLPVAQACEYIRQAACGLAHAHRCGLVHRDIKPHNLLLASGAHYSPGEALVKLTDLGLARLPRASKEEMTAVLSGVEGTGTLTPENAGLIGTADYMAPEQALDFHKADIRSDIYSLGCTLFYLLTGQPPFAGVPLAQKLMKHLQADPPNVTTLRPDVPAGLAALLRRMLAKKPDERYQTPDELATALGALDPSTTAQTATPAAPLPWQSRTRGMKRRRFLLYGTAGVLATAGVGLWLRSNKRPPALVSGNSPPSDPSPLDQLVPTKIPEAERFPDMPPELVAIFGQHGEWSRDCVSLSRDGRWLASSAQGLDLWNLSKGTHKKLHNERVASVAFYDHFLAANVSTGQPSPRDTLVLWNLDNDKPPRTFKGSMNCLGVAFSPKGDMLASAVVQGDDKGDLRIWNVGTGELSWSPRGDPRDSVTYLTFSPDGRLACIHYRSVTFWDMHNRKMTNRIPLDANTMSLALAFFPDGQQIAAVRAVGRKSITLWDIKSPQKLEVLEGFAGDVRSSAFHPSRKVLAAGSTEGELLLWDLSAKPKLLRRWFFRSSVVNPRGGINALLFAADGRHLLTGNADGTLYVLRIGSLLSGSS